jgi:AraC-like DNA-binding protein
MSESDIYDFLVSAKKGRTCQKRQEAKYSLMPSSVLREIDRRGKTVQWSLTASDCPAFKPRRIWMLGYSEAGAGYEVVRRNPSFSNINVTISGKGEALIGGEWRKLTPGTAVLSPKGVLHGSRSIPGTRWEFCWICFAESPGIPSRIPQTACTLTHTDPRPIAWTLLSLQREMRQARQKPVIDAQLQLLDAYLHRILDRGPVENHLWPFWEKVAQDPAHNWTEDEMARHMRLSSRHLLRLCKKETGRTLREQLAHIRLTRAASLLHERALKLQAIAESVGYRDAFAFSKAFKRWSGVSPKSYRARL